MEKIPYRRFLTKIHKKTGNYFLDKIGIEISNKCNLDCKFCYLGENKNLGEEIPTERVREIGKTLKKLGFLITVFLGGEPLVREDFVSLYKYFYSLGLLPALATNGTLIDENIAKLFKKYPPSCLVVSIYAGSDEGYEKITKRKGVFTTIVKGLDFLKNENVNFVLRFLITKDSLDEIEKMKKLVHHYNVFYIVNAAKYVRGVHERKLCLQEDKYKIKYKDMVTLKKKCPEFYKKLLKTENIFHLRHAIPCRGILYINNEEKIQLCPALREAEFDLKKVSLEKVLEKIIIEKKTIKCPLY